MLIKVAIPNQVQLKLVPNFPTLFMGKQNDVHYIGGAEVLPAPLEAEAEAKAAELTKEELKRAAADCETLKQNARGRLEQAAQLIVGRVVER